MWVDRCWLAELEIGGRVACSGNSSGRRLPAVLFGGWTVGGDVKTCKTYTHCVLPAWLGAVHAALIGKGCTYHAMWCPHTAHATFFSHMLLLLASADAVLTLLLHQHRIPSISCGSHDILHILWPWPCWCHSADMCLVQGFVCCMLSTALVEREAVRSSYHSLLELPSLVL